MLAKISIGSTANFVKRLWQMIFGRRWFPLDNVTERLTTLNGWDQKALKDCRLAVMGCGALGGNFSIWAARYGVGEIWLADDDAVEASNFPRQPFTYEDVGINKAIALRYHVLESRIDRATKVKALPYRFENVVFAGLIPDPDLLFVGVDNDPSRRWAIKFANRHGIPAIVTGMDGQAANGYVFVQKSKPDCPCPACFWPSLAQSMGQGACAPVSAGIAITIVGISLAALESLLMGRPVEWDVKRVSLPGGVEGSYRVAKRPNCELCGSL
jgi:molybdopterin/thiamine biosynthesis adenylyltransferase